MPSDKSFPGYCAHVDKAVRECEAMALELKSREASLNRRIDKLESHIAKEGL